MTKKQLESMSNREVYELMLSNRERYNDLVDRRINGEISPSEFRRREVRMNYLSGVLKARLRILAVGEAMYCSECNDLFTVHTSETSTSTELRGCYQHRRRSKLDQRRRGGFGG